MRPCSAMTEVTFQIRDTRSEQNRPGRLGGLLAKLLTRGSVSVADGEVSPWAVDASFNGKVLQSFGAQSLDEAKAQVVALQSEVDRDGLEVFCDHHGVPNARRPKPHG